MTKKSWLNRATVISLGLAFAAAATVFTVSMNAQEPLPPKPPVASGTLHGISPQLPSAKAEAGHTFWNMKSYGVVLDVWNCPESGVCIRVASVDPTNEKLRKVLADRILKKKVEDVTDAEVQRLCGFQPVFTLNRENGGDGPGDLGKWKGKVMIPWEQLTGKSEPDHGIYGVEIDDRANNDNAGMGETLHIRGFWLKPWPLSAIVSGSGELTPVAEPPQACHVPQNIRIANDPGPTAP
jgi:hypothetical protein